MNRQGDSETAYYKGRIEAALEMAKGATSLCAERAHESFVACYRDKLASIYDNTPVPHSKNLAKELPQATKMARKSTLHLFQATE